MIGVDLGVLISILSIRLFRNLRPRILHVYFPFSEDISSDDIQIRYTIEDTIEESCYVKVINAGTAESFMEFYVRCKISAKPKIEELLLALGLNHSKCQFVKHPYDAS